MALYIPEVLAIFIVLLVAYLFHMHFNLDTFRLFFIFLISAAFCRMVLARQRRLLEGGNYFDLSVTCLRFSKNALRKMWENTDQNNSEYGHFSRSYIWLFFNMFQPEKYFS